MLGRSGEQPPAPIIQPPGVLLGIDFFPGELPQVPRIVELHLNILLAVRFNRAPDCDNFTGIVIDGPETMLSGEIDRITERMPLIFVIRQGRNLVPALIQITAVRLRIEEKTADNSAPALEPFGQ